jgi:prepilin-type N-terminal cleavage/methylation domain-containing protein/prepilin-type processing-associated H-X9-DG protein
VNCEQFCEDEQARTGISTLRPQIGARPPRHGRKRNGLFLVLDSGRIRGVVKVASTSPAVSSCRCELSLSVRGLSRRQAFSLIELLVVIAIIAILAGLMLPALSQAKERGRSAFCKNNLHQIMLGISMYADEANDYFPWAGSVDGNRDPDWVWGGQPTTWTTNRARWSDPGFGFHAEAGSIFSFVMNQPRVARSEYYRGGSALAYETANAQRSFRVYRCPSSGALGAALRVTYSVTSWLYPGISPLVPAIGLRRSRVVNPVMKILLVDETPNTHHNAMWSPTQDAAQGSFVTHGSQANVGFMDGHITQFNRPQMLALKQGQTTNLYFNPFY